jgi:hypothetical protein
LAGASDRLSRPGHPIAAPTYNILAGASPCRATIAYLGWRIPSLSWLAHPITYLGRRIPLSHCHPLSWLAHPLAAAPFLSLPAYYCHATITYRLSWLVHPIASPPYRILVGTSHPAPPILSRPAHPIAAPHSLILARTFI